MPKNVLPGETLRCSNRLCTGAAHPLTLGPSPGEDRTDHRPVRRTPAPPPTPTARWPDGPAGDLGVPSPAPASTSIRNPDHFPGSRDHLSRARPRRSSRRPASPDRLPALLPGQYAPGRGGRPMRVVRLRSVPGRRGTGAAGGAGGPAGPGPVASGRAARRQASGRSPSGPPSIRHR
jgi:hypothetical protein